jgi:DNA-binding transcriptional LysR family regulator
MSEIDLSRFDLNLLVVFDVLMKEGSVTRAAARLGRTQSAVSHALSRLREQLGDPLMVKVDGRMTASPFAQRLIEEVRPILRSLGRVVEAPQPFDPARSQRRFRVAVPDLCPVFLSSVIERLLREAPGVTIEWLTPSVDTDAAITDGQIDLAHRGGSDPLPEGVEVTEVEPFTWMTYARKDHPACANWGIESWLRWPHVQVMLRDRVRSPVDEVCANGASKRVVAARVPHFSGVAPLIARTNLLATLPPVTMDASIERYGLQPLRPPIPIEPMRSRFFWSFRHTNDSGGRWLRAAVIETFVALQRSAESRFGDGASGTRQSCRITPAG